MMAMAFEQHTALPVGPCRIEARNPRPRAVQHLHAVGHAQPTIGEDHVTTHRAECHIGALGESREIPPTLQPARRVVVLNRFRQCLRIDANRPRQRLGALPGRTDISPVAAIICQIRIGNAGCG